MPGNTPRNSAMLTFAFPEGLQRKTTGGNNRGVLGLAGKYLDATIEPLVFESSEMRNGNPFVREILATGIDLF